MTNTNPNPAPWLKWPPDKKIWAGGTTFILSWIILSIAAHFGVDPQPTVDAITTVMGVPHLDALAALAGIIGFAFAHFTTPSTQDVVQHVTNEIVQIATAEPGNKTTAVVVPEAQSDAKSKELAKAGALPASTVQNMVDAGVVSPKEVA